MAKKITTSIFFISILYFSTGCKKQPDYPLTPVIKLIEVSPLVVKQGSESILIKFSFTDGDGDLGLPQRDTSSDVSILDKRKGMATAIYYNYRLPEIASSGLNKALSGVISIAIPNTFIRPGLNADTLNYTVSIKDRAGRISNEIVTPNIAIYR